MSSKEHADYLMKKALDAGISNPKELANFMGQMQIECGGFVRMSENLNYSGARLLEVFPGRNGMDTLAEAKAITAGGPEVVANAVYGGAWGKKNLGNTEEGDGWTFRGRGYVQLTGRANYERVGKELGLDLVNCPELAEDREVAAKIAVHYWKDRVVPNGHQHDVKGATYNINGGYNHLAERKEAVRAWEKKIEQGYIEKYISDGVQGQDKQTFGILKKTEQDPLLSNPSHPDYALYKQVLAGVEKLPGNSFKSDQEQQNAAAFVACEAKASGLKQIDHVVLNTTNTGLFAVQGRMDDPAHHRLYVDKGQAASQSIEASTQQMNREAQQPQYQQPQPTRESRLSM